jgi:sugar phosphate isomerase/epimerase
MKKSLFAMMMIMMTAVGYGEVLKNHPKTDVYDGWHLAVQCWTFNRFTFFEAIDKARSLGLDWIEAYPGQPISPESKDVKFDHNLSAELRALVTKKLKDSGLTLINYGVVSLGDNQRQARKVFDFAKEMGIETIVSEPQPQDMEWIDKLCQEYKINLAIHNHPKPTKYWDPQIVLDACEGKSNRVGACVDVGHWVRSGLDPVECLKKLAGRIKSVHLKEIDNGGDVVWGRGQGRMKAILEELHRQSFRGVLSIEYEAEWENNLPFVYESILYYNEIASSLKPTNWQGLFTEDLSNADFNPGGWEYRQGLLESTPGKKDIWTKKRYGDFILDLEFKLDKDTNSGVFLRTQDHQWLPWVEVQVEDSFGKSVDSHICGAIFDVLAPAGNAALPVGQWNRLTILAKGSIVQVALNSRAVIDMNLDRWTEARKNPDGSANKFDVAYKDLPREGFIGLQDHGTRVWYRNIKIKELH